VNRAVEIWQSRAAVAARRLVAVVVRGCVWLLWWVIWQLRVFWARISPRARIILILVGLILVSGWTSSAVPSVSEVTWGLAVLLLAFIGFWWIVTAPFPRRRWWGRTG
jgi:hypothetical protein